MRGDGDGRKRSGGVKTPSGTKPGIRGEDFTRLLGAWVLPKLLQEGGVLLRPTLEVEKSGWIGVRVRRQERRESGGVGTSQF